MNARDLAAPDRDWWMPHALIAVFGVLVTAILDAVPGWSAPLRAWMTLAALVFAALSLHAGVQGVASAWHRRWRGAVLAALLTAVLAVATVAMLKLGLRLGGRDGDVLDDAPAIAAKSDPMSSTTAGAGPHGLGK